MLSVFQQILERVYQSCHQIASISLTMFTAYFHTHYRQTRRLILHF
ncbi:MAG: hypothetical protein DRO67_02770 [Candidatus Asgardarchaeum californiense]|nr:MAG: hypothetical protein DRO67_02770 [Candidatus Asgardarchaeum californiense]